MRIVFITLLSFLLFLGSCQPTPSKLSFNNKLVLQHYKIESELDTLSKSIALKDIVGIEKAHHSLKKTLQDSHLLLSQQDSSTADSSYTSSFCHYCMSYETRLDKFINLVKKSYNIPDKNYTLIEHSKLESAIRDFNYFRKENIYQLEIAQESFARKHNLVISDAEKR